MFQRPPSYRSTLLRSRLSLRLRYLYFHCLVLHLECRQAESNTGVMTATNININFGGELEAKAQSILADLGLDVPTAINLFLTQVVENKALPFALLPETDNVKTASGKRPRSELKGYLKGKVWMADDFNAPLEEMREYME